MKAAIHRGREVVAPGKRPEPRPAGELLLRVRGCGSDIATIGCDRPAPAVLGQGVTP